MPTPRTQDETLSWSGETPGESLLFGASFKAGDVLESRYRIIRFIAAGGVGEVYEATDEELDQQVALKTIRRSRASDNDVVERLKREVQLARQITHPNVCRLYELGHHEQENGQRLLFLTMELLDGESLWDRVQSGALDTETALPLVRQMTAGLDAAHRAGVVHRDFKSSNVMLVPGEDDGGLRAVITDFGLARSVDELPDKRLTSHDMRVGTPAYMAPEQVQGLEATARSDIYSLGVVLFEMLTGRLPFEGNPLASAYQRLTQPPSSPCLYVPDLDRRWEHGILRCLEREPDRRFPGALDLASALDPENPAPLVSRLPSWTFGAAVLFLLFATVIGLKIVGSNENERTAPGEKTRQESIIDSSIRSSVSERRSVAVLGLADLSGREDLAWLASALSEMLTTEAAAGDRLRVIAGDDVARVRLELGLDNLPQLDRPRLSQIGRLLGCELVVDGSFLVTGEKPSREIRLDLVARRVGDGQEIARLKERGSETDLLDLVEAAGQSLRASLDLEALTDDEAEDKRASLPSPKAARFYGQGLELLRRQETQQARKLLEKAIAADPDHPLPRAALAAALRSLGFRRQAKEEARRALDRTEGLPRRDRMWVEAQAFEVDGKYRDALVLYQSLWSYFHDDAAYGRRLARLQARVGDAPEAMKTIEELRQLTPDDEPSLDLLAARAARAVGKFKEQQRLAQRAAESADRLGATILAARAREVEAGAWRDLGQHDRSLEAFATVIAAYGRAGLEGSKASAMVGSAVVHRHQGRLEEAKKLTEDAIEIADRINAVGTRRFALNTKAIILRQEGCLAESLRLHELELEAQRLSGEDRSIAVTLTSLGVVERRLARLDDAERHFKEALEIARRISSRRTQSIALNLLGEIDLRRGQLDIALERFEEALATNQKTEDPRGRAYYLSALGDVDYLSGRLEEAHVKYEEALHIRQGLGEIDNVARSQLALASLALDGGQHEDAIELANQALVIFARRTAKGSEALASVVLAKAHARSGQQAHAEQLANRALSLVADLQVRETVLRVELAAAEVSNHADAAQKVATDAAALGLLDLELEALLLSSHLTEDELAWHVAAARADTLSLRQLSRRPPYDRRP